MKVRIPGHVYEVANLDAQTSQEATQLVTFVGREPENDRQFPGTQSQELLRVLINHAQYCNARLAWEGNADIIYHLRMALVLHEARALLRKTETGKIAPERVVTAKDGHIQLFYTPEES